MHTSGFQCRSFGLECLKPLFPRSSSNPCVGSNLTSLGSVFSCSSSASLRGQLQHFLRSLFLWTPTSSPTPVSGGSFRRQHPFLLFHRQPSALHPAAKAATRRVWQAGQALCFSQREPCSPDHLDHRSLQKPALHPSIHGPTDHSRSGPLALKVLDHPYHHAQLSRKSTVTMAKAPEPSSMEGIVRYITEREPNCQTPG